MKKLLRINWAVMSILVLLSAASCKKELTQQENNNTVKSMDDLVVPANFDFSTSKTLAVKVTSSDLLGQPAAKVEIFNGNPNDGGMVVQEGITDKSQVFETQITIPSYQEQVYIRRTTSAGQITTATIEISGTNLEYTFSANKSYGEFKNGVTGPGCTSCTVTIANHQTGNLDLNAGQTVCILTGASFTGNLNLNGGTLKVCGTLMPQNINGSTGTIIINDDGAFISSILNMNGTGFVIENYSDAFMVSAAPMISGTFKNYGQISFAGSNINSGGKLYNYGVLNFSNHYNNSNITYNEGILNIAGNVNNNGSATFENHCRVNVAGNFNNNSTLSNYSYMDINGLFTLNGGGYLQLYDQALVEAASMMINEDITGNGSNYSKVIVAGATTINSGAYLSGKLDFCDENGIEVNNGSIAASVTYCEASIPETFCNPGSTGNGGGTTDTDGDGVDDDFDDYPTDPDRAFNNYFPDENTYGALAFEDLWPYKGDYDFNDLVIDYQFNTVTNANDNAVEMIVKLSVKAIGAAYKNGFGIELPVSGDVISGVTGDFSLTQNIVSLNNKNLENNQSKAVIVFFDNAFDLLAHPGDGTGVNTRIGATYVEPQMIEFLVSFNYPINPANLGQAPFNPFIFVNGERGREVHLKNFAPTSLVSSGLFGTGQDATVPAQSHYYLTENGLPWAINMVEGFDYPIEKAPIISAYNYFAPWAESGGVQHTNWFTTEAGNRNNAYIYTH